MIVYAISRLWTMFMTGLLWTLDTFCDTIAEAAGWLFFNLILRWLQGDDNQ